MMRALPEEFTIRESSSDGLGLFANRELIIFPTAISHIYHPFIGWLRTAVGAFINHSESPNCTVKESTTKVHTRSAIDDFNLDRYLLGSRYNESDGVVIKVRYLLQNSPINEGDEITIEYEDVLYHGLGPIDYTRLSSAQEKEGPTSEDKLELVGHAI
tara:strand:- start:5233 stop:5706 length:474 start_codon:yes stop_codon:yes gene_type:complete